MINLCKAEGVPSVQLGLHGTIPDAGRPPAQSQLVQAAVIRS